MNTILITGCSSGFGLATARLFLDHGWSVVATMRTPRTDLLPASNRLRILPLDVTDPASIAHAIEQAGPIDVLVNNAGIGLRNALEGIPMENARAVFETNTLGTIAMTQAVLPQFRQRRAGTIVNVTSSVTQRPLHLLSVYTASKAAVNAFTECLALELEPFGIRTRLVIPGRSPETPFGANARARMGAVIPAPYADQAAPAAPGPHQPEELVTRAIDVAEAVWRAATDPACPMRLPAGADAVAGAAAGLT
jgi:NAD(P)-dependent dehydrogenase (short-subunit alcohol dehydrogenase family)